MISKGRTQHIKYHMTTVGWATNDCTGWWPPLDGISLWEAGRSTSWRQGNVGSWGLEFTEFGGQGDTCPWGIGGAGSWPLCGGDDNEDNRAREALVLPVSLLFPAERERKTKKCVLTLLTKSALHDTTCITQTYKQKAIYDPFTFYTLFSTKSNLILPCIHAYT